MSVAPIIDLYFWIMENARHSMQEGAKTTLWDTPENAVQIEIDYNVLWARLRDARLFNVPTVLLMDTYAEAHDHLANLVRLGEDDELDPEVGTDLILKRSREAPFPEQLPFDNTLLLYPWTGRKADGSRIDKSYSHVGPITGAGLVLEDHELEWRFGKPAVASLRQQGQAWAVVGHLLCHDGEVYELLRCTRLVIAGTNYPIDTSGSFDELIQRMESLHPSARIDVHCGFAVTKLRDNSVSSMWASPLSMNPWALPAMIYMINDYKTLVLQSPKKGRTALRMATRKFAKRNGLKRFTPPHYYGIMLHDDVVFVSAVDRQFNPDGRSRYANFRSDVRGHERVRIRRGPMPMDPEERQKYLDRGYRLYEEQMDLDPEDDKRLRERGQTLKARGEWLALKVSWVDQYIKGPEEAPYRPAVRHLPARQPASWGGADG